MIHNIGFIINTRILKRFVRFLDNLKKWKCGTLRYGISSECLVLGGRCLTSMTDEEQSTRLVIIGNNQLVLKYICGFLDNYVDGRHATGYKKTTAALHLMTIGQKTPMFSAFADIACSVCPRRGGPPPRFLRREKL